MEGRIKFVEALIQFKFHLQITFQVFARINGNLRLLMGRKHFNFCDFVKKHKGNTIFDSVLQNFVKFANIPKEGCPIPPAKYAVNGFVVELSKIPAIFPSGNYYAFFNIITLNEKKIKVSIAQISVEVKFVN